MWKSNIGAFYQQRQICFWCSDSTTNAFQVEILFAASWMIALISFAESTSPHSLRSSFPLVLLRFQNVSCRSVSVGFSEKTSVFGSV